MAGRPWSAKRHRQTIFKGSSSAARFCRSHDELCDPALKAISDKVRDIDLKDDKFAPEETSRIAHLILGLAKAKDCNEERVLLGAAIFDDLCLYFHKERR